MKVIKRDASLVEFDRQKIYNAIMKAMKNGSGFVKPKIAESIAKEIEEKFINENTDEIDISDIESLVYDKLITKKQKLTAKAYEGYRKVREFQRDNVNTTDEEIEELLTGTSEYWMNENSNKDEKLVTTQRDYMAGIVSKDMSRRYLLTPEIVQAHDEGIIHFHDIDYFGQKTLHNCDLINLEDMLQNGTVISGTLIEKPHSFSTACNIATQIIAQVASSQYGGQTITLSHLAPFVDVSRKKIREEVEEELNYINGGGVYEDQLSIINEITKSRLAKEVKKGVQTIQYQVVTLMTTNGQAPFLSVNMYLNEVEDEQTKADLALIIEEVLKQRIQGVKNEQGVWITPAFPKLLYVLEDDNIHEGDKYWYLTKLAAQCTAKRMVPDYISEKKMLEYKIDKNGNGNCYPCMGCVDGSEVITYKYDNNLYVESFKRMWDRLSDYFNIKKQYENSSDNLYMDVSNVQIYDTEKGFVNVQRVIRNLSDEWVNVKLSHGRSLICTPDHPFHTNNGRKRADELNIDDVVQINPDQYYEETKVFNPNKAWLLGFILCDGCYDGHVTSSIAYESENDIEEIYKFRMKQCFDSDVKTVERHRGVKGRYKDLCSKGNVMDIIDYLSTKFEGLTKARRHIM